jgi:cytolethal distending toxin subunit B
MLSFCLPTQAALDKTVVSWNMQGSSASTENKWQSGVLQLLGSADIVALQEAGQVPTSARIMTTGANTGGGSYEEYSWGGTSRSNGNFIYFLQTDTRGNRVNLAIATRQRADEVIVLPPARTGSRPTLGVRFGNDFYFSIHALSNGGTDVPRIITQIDGSVRRMNPNNSYMILGDYNRAPTTWTPPVNVQTMGTGQTTQQSGGELDYAASNLPSFNSLFNAYLMGIFLSDHYPVQIKRN